MYHGSDLWISKLTEIENGLKLLNVQISRVVRQTQLIHCHYLWIIITSQLLRFSRLKLLSLTFKKQQPDPSIDQMLIP